MYKALSVRCQRCTKKKITLRCMVIGTYAVQFLRYIPLYRNTKHYATLNCSVKRVYAPQAHKISSSEQIAEIKLNSNTTHLRSGTIWSISNGSCIDWEGGYTFWNPKPIDNCKCYHYSLLYEGLANKMFNYDLNDLQNILFLKYQFYDEIVSEQSCRTQNLLQNAVIWS